MTTPPVALQELNTLDQESFVQALHSLFEGPPWIVREAWHARLFESVAHLHQALCHVMYNAPVEQQVALLQAAAGLAHLSPEEIATFTRLNEAYRDRFGFPFVICAREDKKDSILAGFATRLRNSREQEIAIALGEVAKICSLRLRDAVR